MTSSYHKFRSFFLVGLAVFVFGLALQDQSLAAYLFQSPLPEPSTPCISQTLSGFTLEVFGFVNNGDGTTTITYRVTNTNKKDISYVAFGLGNWSAVAPVDGSTYSGGRGDYNVEWTNSNGNPGFPSIKYETLFDGFSKGAQDTIALTVSNFDPNTAIQVQMKAGKDKTTFTLTLNDSACDMTPVPTPTPTPQSPLPTPTPELPDYIPNSAAYIIKDADYEQELGEEEREAMLNQGLPVPAVVQLDPAATVRSSASSSYKPGLLSIAPFPSAQALTEGWSVIYAEDFEGGFPYTSKDNCQLTVQAFIHNNETNDYLYGRDGVRGHNDSGWAGWPAVDGNIGVDPQSATYPESLKSRIICTFSNMNAAHNVMTEFAIWQDRFDNGDLFFVGFSVDRSTYKGLEWPGSSEDAWKVRKVFYPDVEGNSGTVSVMWQFTSDETRHESARGAWIDDIKVESYVKPVASANCENLATDASTMLEVTGVPGDGLVSKGLQLPPYIKDDGDLAGKMNRLNDTETHWVRLEFTVQPSTFIRMRDNDTLVQETVDLQYYDRLIDSLCANGIAPLGLIDYATVADTSWEAGGSISDDYLAEFKRITSILVNYFGDRVKAWELWNEPDSQNTDLVVNDYTRLLVETSPIIRDAGDWVVFSGLVSPDNTARDYLAGVYAALESEHNSAETPFDLFAVHPYPSGQYVDANGNFLLAPGDMWLAELPTVFSKFHDTLLGINALNRNDSDKDIWVTEFGWNSAKGSDQDNEDVCIAAEEDWVTEGQQENYLATGLNILFEDTAWPNEDRQSITKAFWYQYRDTGAELNVLSDCVDWPDRNSYNWYLSYMYNYLFGPSEDEVVVVPWSFGLYDGNFQPKYGTHCAFKEYPNWPDACYNFDYQVFLPTINSDTAVSAAGE